MIQPETSTEQLSEEQHRISALLKNEDFALKVAQHLNAAYFTGSGEAVSPLLEDGDETAKVEKSVKEEKIAVNLAGFYALECGIGALCAQNDEKPTDWLQRILDDEADADAVMLLNHFANATWKAGQPFRGLDKITRPVFTVFSLLPEEEVDKDYNQVKTAAGKLMLSMQDIRNGSVQEQMERLRSLLQDEKYACEMAEFLDLSYYLAQNKPAPPFISEEEETTTHAKSVKEEKIATNVAGFYALESGIDYLSNIYNTLPSEIIRSIVEDTIEEKDKQMLCRFANATWKAGQPFRGLDRIKREIFKPFYFFNEDDIEKDWVQLKAAAAMITTVI